MFRLTFDRIFPADLLVALIDLFHGCHHLPAGTLAVQCTLDENLKGKTCWFSVSNEITHKRLSPDRHLRQLFKILPSAS